MPVLMPLVLNWSLRPVLVGVGAGLCNIIHIQLHDAIASGQEVVQRAFDARTDAATARAFHGMPEEVLKAAWIEWRERAYDLAVEDCQKWLRTCEHLRGCNLAICGIKVHQPAWWHQQLSQFMNHNHNLLQTRRSNMEQQIMKSPAINHLCISRISSVCKVKMWSQRVVMTSTDSYAD